MLFNCSWLQLRSNEERDQHAIRHDSAVAHSIDPPGEAVSVGATEMWQRTAEGEVTKSLAI